MNIISSRSEDEVCMKHTLTTYSKGAAPGWARNESGVTVRLDHYPDDPPGVYRLYLERKGISIELCPTKGLSIRDMRVSGKDIFWESPHSNLPDPEEINLEASMLIKGKRVPGTAWMVHFVAGVEMMGLMNWGMPYTDDVNGDILTIHGNASMIPVEEVTVDFSGGGVIVEGSFHIYDANSVWPIPENKAPLYRITKRIEMLKDRNALYLTDVIENVTQTSLCPDWGYHVQLRPENGCQYIIPSRSVEARGGGSLFENHEIWHPAIDTLKRETWGVIHKDISLQGAFPDGNSGFESLLSYPDGSGIRCLLPPSPYVMSWFSSGGAFSDEFLIPSESPGGKDQPWLFRNWDCLGPEIGASALDHDDDTDPDVMVSTLLPGQSMKINLLIEPLNNVETGNLMSKIKKVTIDRD